MKLYIGMPYEEVCKAIENNAGIKFQDMKNGYYWLRGRIPLFGESVHVELCFKDGLLWMIIMNPHYNDDVTRQPFEVLPSDITTCKKWLEEHKDQLPEGSEFFYDRKTPSVGICAR